MAIYKATSIWVYHFKDNDKLNTKLLHYYSKRLNNDLIYVNVSACFR